jgi:hypothetical protein
MGRARDISKVFSTGTALATDTEISAFNYLTQSSASTVYQTKAATGLTLITPTSIAATGGSGSISATGTVSFTSASAISLNGCFTSTYDNYKIVINNILGTTDNVYLTTRFRVSGTDNSSANYYWGSFYVDITNSTSGIQRGSGDTTIQLGYTPRNDSSGLSYDITSPFLTAPTSLTGQTVSRASSSRIAIAFQGHYSSSTSFDGVSIFPQSGTITGTLSVYGYNK